MSRGLIHPWQAHNLVWELFLTLSATPSTHANHNGLINQLENWFIFFTLSALVQAEENPCRNLVLPTIIFARPCSCLSWKCTLFHTSQNTHKQEHGLIQTLLFFFYMQVMQIRGLTTLFWYDYWSSNIDTRRCWVVLLIIDMQNWLQWSWGKKRRDWLATWALPLWMASPSPWEDNVQHCISMVMKGWTG